MTRLTVAIVSDIHAHPVGGDDSYARVQPPASPRNEHPLSDLLTFIDAREMKADYVLCPGDLSNWADDLGKTYGWAKLQELAVALDARAVRDAGKPRSDDPQARAGSSRGPDAFHAVVPEPCSPREIPVLGRGFRAHRARRGASADHRLVLRLPDPPVTRPPTSRRASTGRSWTRAASPKSSSSASKRPSGISRRRTSTSRSCTTTPPSTRRERCSRTPTGRCDAGPSSSGSSTSTPTVGDGSSLRPQARASSQGRGELELADRPRRRECRWETLHPIVTVTRNQSHLVNFDLGEHVGLPRLRGTVESYMWGFGAGWSISARRSSGLPPRCGFGYGLDYRALADLVTQPLRERARVRELE